MSAMFDPEPYCSSEDCIAFECSPEEPCCEALCGPCPASDCQLELGTYERRDGTTEYLLVCHEHKMEGVK